MSALLSIQLLLGLTVLLVALLSRVQSPRAASRTGRLLLLAAVLLPLLLSRLSIEPTWRPPAQVFSQPDGAATLTVPAAALTVPLPAKTRSSALTLQSAAVGLALLWTLLSVASLRRMLGRTRAVRTLGRVEVRVGGPVCFSLALPGRAVVVIDEATWADPRDRLLAVRHELQHHRQGDPRFAWLLQLLVVLFCLNPAAWLLRRQLADLDELACDDALRQRVPVRDYCHVLLRAAQRAAAPRVSFTPGLTRRSLLHRRIQMLTRPPRSAALPLAALSLTVLAAAAHAAEGLLDDGTIDADEFAALAERVDGIDFPLSPVIQDALSRQLESPGTRAFLARGLDRYPEHAPLVDGALQDYGLPAELAAVPLIESGYENLGEHASGYSLAPGIPGKGVWMFIPQTARRYGLTVTAEVDERLDPIAETDAAMRLLSDLYDEFGDWGLALAGYNQGAGHVRTAIAASGTRDPWALTESGALNGYAAQVYAAMLVMEAPELVR